MQFDLVKFAASSLLVKTRYSIVSYLRVSYLLQLMTVTEIALLYFIYHHFNLKGWLSEGNVALKLICLYPLWSPPVFAQLDARSRFQNYKQIKDQIYAYGFKTVILKPVLKSRCQRDAAIVAAEELGYKQQCSRYFYSFGYRWYHLLPDFIFSKPYFLFYWSFWETTFFVNRYRSRFDYRGQEMKTYSFEQLIPFPYVN